MLKRISFLWNALIILLFFTIKLSSQDNAANDLLKSASKAKRTNTDQAMRLIDSALFVAKRDSLPVSFVDGLRMKGTIIDNYDLEHAEIIYSDALRLCINDEYDKVKDNILLNLAQLYKRKGDFTKADSLLSIVLADPLVIENKKSRVAILLEVSSLKMTLGDYGYSINALSECLDIMNSLNDKSLNYYIFDRFSSLYLRTKDFDKSIQYSRMAIDEVDSSDQSGYFGVVVPLVSV